ncbi:MAG: 3-phosphoshikimate 1-carboxyvinyltransferase [Acidimicrobiia bacterium]
MTIRALAMAALASGRSHLYGALAADDTAAMVSALQSLGVAVDTASEPWVVTGNGGALLEPGGVLNGRESGLTARIVIALAALVDGVVTVDGEGRLRERPMQPLLSALAAQGVSVSSSRGLLPVTVTGRGGLWGGDISIDSSMSSQFVTALLIVAPMTVEPTRLRIEGERGAAGYVEMTSRVMSAFGAAVDPTITGYEIPNLGYRVADLEVEPDVSAAVYPMVAAAITGSRVEIEGVGLDSTQPDMAVARHLETMGCIISDGAAGMTIEGPGSGLRPIDIDMAGAPDGAIALAVACLFADGPSQIGGLGTLHHKESDRLEAMRDGLTALGGTVDIVGDSLRIEPLPLSGAVVRSHGDHRVAMSLAVAGLRIEGVLIDQPDVVTKTWPGFWEQMTALRAG